MNYYHLSPHIRALPHVLCAAPRARYVLNFLSHSNSIQREVLPRAERKDLQDADGGMTESRDAGVGRWHGGNCNRVKVAARGGR